MTPDIDIKGLLAEGQTAPMERELRDLWCEALRSGLYEQGHSRQLYREGRFCPLGVFQDITGVPKLSGGELLNYEIANLLGLPFSIQGILTRMNDSYKMSFNEIADWIEQSNL